MGFQEMGSIPGADCAVVWLQRLANQFPACFQWPDAMVFNTRRYNSDLFLNNHDIWDQALKGHVLDQMPSDDKRFGDSKNGGEYILKHPGPSDSLAAIVVRRS